MWPFPDQSAVVQTKPVDGGVAFDETLDHAVGSGHGCVVFVGADGSVVQLAATANLRRAIEQRLGSRDGAAGGSGDEREAGALGGRPRADLREVTVRVEAYSTASAFEADALFLMLAAARSSEAFADASGRLGLAWLVIDPNAHAPRWAIEQSLGDGPSWSHHPGVVRIGPFRSRAEAQALADAMDDLFDLCRYPAELGKRPGGQACAYFEMGRCPAACDGSEPMERYRGRLAEGLRSVRDGTLGAIVSERIAAAVRAMDFERAAAVKKLADGINKACAGGPVVNDGDGTGAHRSIGILPRGRGGWLAVACVEGRLVPLANSVRIRSASGPVASADRGSDGVGEAAGSIGDHLKRCLGSLPDGSLPDGPVVPAPGPGAGWDGDQAAAVRHAMLGLVVREVASARRVRTRGWWLTDPEAWAIDDAIAWVCPRAAPAR